MSTAVTAHESEAAATHEQRAFGFWLYLMGDAVIFALLFATYVIMVNNTAGGPGGSDLQEFTARIFFSGPFHGRLPSFAAVLIASLIRG